MKKIVTIGGGTGSYTVLSGLKKHKNLSLTAVVSMADDGGSTGVLRDELGVLPPGDVRQCLVALSSHDEILRKLMNYRFEEGGLQGHSFGNIFLAALEKVTGSFTEGVEVASKILQVEGRVIPITSDKAELRVKLPDGTLVCGENSINHASFDCVHAKTFTYDEPVTINGEAFLAMCEADYIILGPGNYYCSLLPCLIIEGVQKALQNTSAKLIVPVNLTNKHGHTLGWSVSQYITDIESYIGRKVDIILVNNQMPSDEQIVAYQLQEGDGVLVIDDMAHDSRVIRTPLLSHHVEQAHKADSIASTRSFIRHDKEKLAQVIASL